MRDFADSATLACVLAQAVADDLRAGIAARGTAAIALSGGTTPRRFLRELSMQALAWFDVDVTLTDERWVAPDNVRSNEHLLRDTLLQGDAAAARFVPLYAPAPQPESVLVEIAANVAKLPQPFDAVVLGMGEDGHCASLFPGGDRLAEALRAGATARVLPMRAPGAGEPRITLTLSALMQTRALYLHIEGAVKRAALERALASGDAPVARVLACSRATPQIFWCP